MRLQRYREAKRRTSEARAELDILLKPTLSDTKLIEELHSATLKYYDVEVLAGAERERFVTAVMLLYSPLSIYEKKQSPRHLNSAIGRVLGISKSSVSQIVSSGRFIYHNVDNDRRKVDDLVDHFCL